MLVRYTYTDNPSHFASTWCSPWNICCHSFHSSPEMKPPAQILAQFPTSFISCLLHLSQQARKRVQCKFIIVQRETLYTLHQFSTWESQRVFLSFVTFFRLFWLCIIWYTQTLQTKSTRRRRKRFEVSPWFRDNPWDRGDFNLAITGNAPVSATTGQNGRSRGTIRIVVKLVVSHKY